MGPRDNCCNAILLRWGPSYGHWGPGKEHSSVSEGVSDVFTEESRRTVKPKDQGTEARRRLDSPGTGRAALFSWGSTHSASLGLYFPEDLAFNRLI